MISFFILSFPNVKILFIPAWAIGLFLIYENWNYEKNEERVSHSGHVGGLIAGLLIFVLKKFSRF